MALYLAAYFTASYVDLATTSLGLQREGVSEKNIFATDAAGGYVASQAWLLTLAGAIAMSLCILFASQKGSCVREEWLEHPMRSFSTFYLNPFSKRGLSVAPLHALSLALAFLILRVLAGANNLLVYQYGWGPIGEAIEWLSDRTSSLAGFCIVVFTLFGAGLVAMTPVAARIILAWRKP